MDYDGPNEVILIGYSPLMAEGFALPCFAIAPQSNSHYTAICTIDGDHNARVAGFESFELADVHFLPSEQQRSIKIGDLWQDIVLWDGKTYVGTPSDIWEALQPMRDSLAKKIPITLLDLSLQAAPDEARELTPIAISYVRKHYGDLRANKWKLESLLRPQVQILARRLAFADDILPQVKKAINSIEILEQKVGEFQIDANPLLWENLSKTGRLEDFDIKIESLAERLDLKFLGRAPTSLNPPKVEENLLEQPLQPPIQENFNILIIVSGRRAKEIARNFSVPFGRPSWSNTRDPQNVYTEHSFEWLDTPKLFTGSLSPYIHIAHDVSEIENILSYAVVVYLTDDDVLTNKTASNAYGYTIDFIKTQFSGISLLAPAIPNDRPSKLLVDNELSFENYGFDTVIDTSVARSPFWSGNTRRSLDRRIADIVIDAALLCLNGSPVASYLIENRYLKSSNIMSFAYSTKSKRDSLKGFSSESTWSQYGHKSSRKDVLASFEFKMIPNQKKIAHDALGLVEIRNRHFDFPNFADLVLKDLQSDRIIPRHKAAPENIINQLQYPKLSAGFYLPQKNINGLLITAETPSTSLIKIATSYGWAVVRYTDKTSLSRILSSDLDLPFIPDEIYFQKLRKIPANKGFAKRGVDPRDIIKIDSRLYDDLKDELEISELNFYIRRYRASIHDEAANSAIKEFVFPTNEFFTGSLSKNAQNFIKRLLKAQLSVRPPKRAGDLRAAWVPPIHDSRRFVMADSTIPVTISELDFDEVPDQRMFIMDGDGSVPALLLSCVFEVWARATISKSLSWMPRFSITGTFETFPLSPVFTLERDKNNACYLHLEKRNNHLKKVVSQFDKSKNMLGRKGQRIALNRSSDISANFFKELDIAVLDAYDLNSKATDLQILERLLELNKTSSRE